MKTFAVSSFAWVFSLVLVGCVNCTTDSPPVVQREERILKVFPPGPLGMDEGDIEQSLAIWRGVYYLMPMANVVGELGEGDRRLDNLRHLREFRLPARGYALVYDLGRYECCIISSKDEKLVRNVVFVDKERNVGFEAARSKGRVLGEKVKEGMSEAEVQAILGEPDRVVRDAGGVEPNTYHFYYDDTVPGSSGAPLLVVFSATDRRVVCFGEAHVIGGTLRQ